MKLNRRAFLRASLFVAVAPIIIKASSLMAAGRHRIGDRITLHGYQYEIITLNSNGMGVACRDARIMGACLASKL